MNCIIRVIQGSGLQGPIPSGIALLEKLSDLSVWKFGILIWSLLSLIWFQSNRVPYLILICRRISDLNGLESQVPRLRCTNITTLWEHCSFSNSLLNAREPNHLGNVTISVLFPYRILRSCNLIGELPGYLAEMTPLKILWVENDFSPFLFQAE